jgi:exodeoxyribonuclease VII large subunit
MSEQSEVYSLRDLNNNLKVRIESQTLKEPFWVSGVVQISYGRSDYGHIYFTLMDGDYSINCMLHERVKTKLDFKLTNRMEVEVYGTARIWDKQAQLQIDVERINVLQNATSNNVLERLKQQDLYPKTKKPLPHIINRVAVITSQNSRALEDFYTYYKKHDMVKLIPVPLEGYSAAQRIAEAIKRVNDQREADVVVLIRGGGERTALDTFDDYLVAEAICRSSIPVMTGIGHQGDETIADKVADFPCSTPTAVGIELTKASSPPTPTTPQIVNPVLPRSRSWQTVILLLIGFMFALALLIFAISQLS